MDDLKLNKVSLTNHNLLNLPDSIVTNYNDVMLIRYLADGRRVQTLCRKLTTPLSVPADNVLFSGDPTITYEEMRARELLIRNGRMDRVEFAGGYFSLINDSTGYADISARSYVLDYPGSVRAVCDGESGKLLESIDYMPSGLVFGRMNHDMPHRRFFCGKEELPLTELKLYDSTARLQDAYIPRFTTMDPLAEKYYHISPYNYGANNPVNMIDPDGRDWIDKVVGVIIGTVTNVIPGTSNLRDTYSPNDAGDYNNTLRTVDGVSIVVGGGMMTGGGAGVGAGTSIVIAGGVTASTVVGAPEGAAIAAGGAVVITGSEALMAGGAMLTANAAANASKGYDYGNSSQTSTKVKTRQSKGADGATSKHIIEKDAKGKTISKTHQVTSPDGKVVHQHQDFVSQTPQKGQKPITRQFPDEWVKYPNINTK